MNLHPPPCIRAAPVLVTPVQGTKLTHIPSLADLGWSGFYLSQLDLDDLALPRLRVAQVHRTRIAALGQSGPADLALPPDLPAGQIAVGDWVLVDGAGRVVRCLDRQSLLARRAAGTGAERQLIAANVDTLLITTSCNADFNTSRLERYLALSAEAGCEPVLVLTKADMAEAAPYLARAAALQRGVAVVALDARSADNPARLANWCRKGQTVALAGSSGVGKSTLAASLTGSAERAAPIRDDDARGRHTTTWRTMLPMLQGGWIIDSPGMRALRLTDAADGIDRLFADVTDLAAACRFRDCQHDTEPGCAVQAAVAAGEVAADRLSHWRKLRREDRFNSETLHQAHARHRAFGRMHKTLIRDLKPRGKG